MKRLLMLLTTFCLLLMTTALAETEAEWNAKCEWKPALERRSTP